MYLHFLLKTFFLKIEKMFRMIVVFFGCILTEWVFLKMSSTCEHIEGTPTGRQLASTVI